jgi:hypothetical protein
VFETFQTVVNSNKVCLFVFWKHAYLSYLLIIEHTNNVVSVAYAIKANLKHKIFPGILWVQMTKFYRNFEKYPSICYKNWRRNFWQKFCQTINFHFQILEKSLLELQKLTKNILQKLTKKICFNIILHKFSQNFC